MGHPRFSQDEIVTRGKEIMSNNCALNWNRRTSTNSSSLTSRQANTRWTKTIWPRPSAPMTENRRERGLECGLAIAPVEQSTLL